jgi:hypothetical protein
VALAVTSNSRKNGTELCINLHISGVP